MFTIKVLRECVNVNNLLIFALKMLQIGYNCRKRRAPAVGATITKKHPKWDASLPWDLRYPQTLPYDADGRGYIGRGSSGIAPFATALDAKYAGCHTPRCPRPQWFDTFGSLMTG